MKRTILFIAFVLPIFLSAQNEENFTEIDQIARDAPWAASHSIDELATYLTRNAKTDIQKVRSFYVWVTDNIRYDTKLYFSNNVSSEKWKAKQKAEKVLKTKIGVCEGYANLFHELCIAANIPSEIVTGYTKNQRGIIPRVGHAWNAVRIDGNWFLIDNTWGAGYIDDENNRFRRKFQEKYFLADPRTFVLDHYPNDYLFQLSDKPVSWNLFQKKEIEIKQFIDEVNEPESPHFQDSLSNFHALESDKKTVNSFLRILRAEPKSSYANFQAAKYYFNQSKNSFFLYREDVESLNGSFKNLQKEDMPQWAAIIKSSKNNLDKAKNHIEIIPRGDRFYKNAIITKKNIKMAASNLRIADKQMKQFEAYLNKKGK